MSSEVHESSKTKRTRVRIPSSCSVCRARKMKCDKKRPFCGTCRINSTEDSCKYEPQPWYKVGASSTVSVEEVTANMKIMEEKILSLERRCEVQSKMLSFIGNREMLGNKNEEVEKKEYGDLISLEKFRNRTCIKNLNLLCFGPTCSYFFILNDSYIYPIFSDYFNDQVRRFRLKVDSLECQTNVALRTPGPLGNKIFNSDVSIDGDTSKYPQLPPWRIIEILVERFFEVCSGFVPFIEETTFKKELNQIFKDGKRINDEDIFYRPSTVAILFIVLRFSYLTLPFKKFRSGRLHDTQYELIREVLDNDTSITPTHIQYAKKLILNGDSFEKIDFRKIQALLLLGIYRMNCPEEDDTSSSNIIGAIMSQMGKLYGIHRIPENLHLFSHNDIDVWKKTWASLLYYDAVQSFDWGMPLYFQENGAEKIDLNELFNDISNVELTKARNFRLQCTNTILIRRALQMLNNGVEVISKKEFEELLSDFDILMKEETRNFEELYYSRCHTFTMFDTVYELALRIEVVYVAFCNYFLLYLAVLEKEKEKYLPSVLETAFIILGFSIHFEENPNFVVSSDFEIIIGSRIWKPLRAVVSSLGGVLMRASSGDNSLINASKHFKFLDPLVSIFWSKIDYDSEQNSINNILQHLEYLYHMTTPISVKYARCYHLCCTLKYTLEHFKKEFSLSNQTITDSSAIGNKSKGYEHSNSIDQFWNKDINFDTTFEDFLSKLDYNMDPLINVGT